jgi:hypothetical protein
MNERSNRKLIMAWIVLSILIIAGTPLYHLLLKCLEPLITKRGLFGDQFGALNATFTGLAFIGVIISILLQHSELRANNAAFRETAAAQRESIEAQRESLRVQQIDAELQANLQIVVALGQKLQHNASRLDAVGEVLKDVKLQGERRKKYEDLLIKLVEDRGSVESELDTLLDRVRGQLDKLTLDSAPDGPTPSDPA